MKYEVEVRCSVDAPGELDAKAWIDSDARQNLDSEQALPLTRSEPGVWLGHFGLPPGTGHFYYRIGIGFARAGSWLVRIRDLRTGEVLQEDADTLEVPKTWLLGSCTVSR